jgi:hypothetical protein
MTIDIIKNFFIFICFTVILFLSSSSFYLSRSNYVETNGIIEESKCTDISSTQSKIYFCELTISYFVNEHKSKVTTKLAINSNKIYNVGDNIKIEYDNFNYLNITIKTEYKSAALLSCILALLFLIYTAVIYQEIKDSIIKKINWLLNYVSFFT